MPGVFGCIRYKDRGDRVDHPVRVQKLPATAKAPPLSKQSPSWPFGRATRKQQIQGICSLQGSWFWTACLVQPSVTFPLYPLGSRRTFCPFSGSGLGISPLEISVSCFTPSLPRCKVCAFLLERWCGLGLVVLSFGPLLCCRLLCWVFVRASGGSPWSVALLGVSSLVSLWCLCGFRFLRLLLLDFFVVLWYTWCAWAAWLVAVGGWVGVSWGGCLVAGALSKSALPGSVPGRSAWFVGRCVLVPLWGGWVGGFGGGLCLLCVLVSRVAWAGPGSGLGAWRRCLRVGAVASPGAAPWLLGGGACCAGSLAGLACSRSGRAWAWWCSRGARAGAALCAAVGGALAVCAVSSAVVLSWGLRLVALGAAASVALWSPCRCFWPRCASSPGCPPAVALRPGVLLRGPVAVVRWRGGRDACRRFRLLRSRRVVLVLLLARCAPVPPRGRCALCFALRAPALCALSLAAALRCWPRVCRGLLWWPLSVRFRCALLGCAARLPGCACCWPSRARLGAFCAVLVAFCAAGFRILTRGHQKVRSVSNENHHRTTVKRIAALPAPRQEAAARGPTCRDHRPALPGLHWPTDHQAKPR